MLEVIELRDTSALPDPEEALRFMERFRHESPAGFARVAASAEATRYVLAVFAHSAFLSEAVIRNPEWLVALEDAADMYRVLPVADFLQRGAGTALAAFRRRELLRILLRDVLGYATLRQVTEELSNLADAILALAWRQLPREWSGLGFSVLSLGKLGGRELNYSSDIDLMFVHDGSAPDAAQRAAHRFTEMLSNYSGDGMCYRVDLRLRPDGRYGEICQPLEGAKRYYRERARDWEIQMLIKARVSAADDGPGRELIAYVEPLVYPEMVPARGFDTLSGTRERIHEKLQRSQRSGLDIKLTRGGIRDIEFLVQRWQRLHGGREPSVRHWGTQEALVRLRDAAIVSDSEYVRLNAAYEFLRHLEHRLQFYEDRQTHTLPTEMEALDVLARKMPSGLNAGTLERELDGHLAAVRQTYDELLGKHDVQLDARGADKEPSDAFETLLEKLEAHPKSQNYLARNDEVRACVRELLEDSRFFANELVRYPELIGEVANACGERQGRVGFTPPETVEGLRRFFREQMVRIQSDSVCHCAPIFKTLKRTSSLADSVIASAYRIAAAEASAHEMMAIALGRLGMREFDLASDADLVFVIPDRCAAETPFWTTVAERMVHAIGDYTGDGVLFTVDTRLRPNGREGPLVQTESAYKDYFARHAEAWEGISYMKARGVAGDIERATAFLEELQQVDWRRYGQNGRSRQELAGMRARLEKEQGARNPLKAGAGGYYDIDFALLYYRLKGAGMFYKTLNTPERIDIVEKMGHLEREDAEFLREAATFYRAIDHGMRVTTGHAEGRLPTAPGDRATLARLVAKWDVAGAHREDLEQRLNRIRMRTRQFFDRVFA